MTFVGVSVSSEPRYIDMKHELEGTKGNEIPSLKMILDANVKVWGFMNSLFHEAPIGKRCEKNFHTTNIFYSVGASDSGIKFWPRLIWFAKILSSSSYTVSSISNTPNQEQDACKYEKVWCTCNRLSPTVGEKGKGLRFGWRMNVFFTLWEPTLGRPITLSNCHWDINLIVQWAFCNHLSFFWGLQLSFIYHLNGL